VGNRKKSSKRAASRGKDGSIADALRVRGKSLDLSRWDPDATPGIRDREEAAERLARNLQRMDALQYGLYAEGRRSLVLVFQGMDAAGKDGVIRKVATAFNPQGCRAWSFKAPTPEELAHDFLWRIHRAAPAKGEVAIFNRSHYEDVLVVRVHGLVPKPVWSERYAIINEFERRLHEHGTTILKFFLHISREEQLERIRKRLEDPAKHWKFSEADLDERTRWDDYQRAFEDALARCSTKHAPWFVIPANRKWYRDVAVSEIVTATLEDMDPRPNAVKLDLKRLMSRLARDGAAK
jgi:PPK2 family polyphosphate:nucleotide phosphotransferase